VQEYSGAFKSF